METEVIEATVVGHAALTILPLGGEVHSVFKTAINLVAPVTSRQHLVAVLSSDVHPNAVTCPALPAPAQAYFHPESSFAWLDGRLMFNRNGPIINLASAAIEIQAPLKCAQSPALAKNNQILKQYVAASFKDDPLGITQRLTTLAGEWKAAEFPPPGWEERLKPLVGIGPGLTPLGDDFISGYLAAAYHLSGCERDRAAFREKAPALAEGNTTFFSQMQIRLAGQGRCLGSIFRVIQSLSSGSFEPRLIQPVLAIGATSGYGWLLGISTAAGHRADGAQS